MAKSERMPPDRLYKNTENPVNSPVRSNFILTKMITSDFFSVKIATSTMRLLKPNLAPGAKANGDGNDDSTMPMMVATAVNKAI